MNFSLDLIGQLLDLRVETMLVAGCGIPVQQAFSDHAVDFRYGSLKCGLCRRDVGTCSGFIHLFDRCAKA